MSSSYRSGLILLCSFFVACGESSRRGDNEAQEGNAGGNGGDEGGGHGGDPAVAQDDAGAGKGGSGGSILGAGSGGGPQANADAGAPDSAPTSHLFVRTGNRLLIETSCDGKTWKKPNVEAPMFLGSDEGHGFRFVSQAGGILIATGGGNEGSGGLEKLYTSEDGVSWKARRTGQGDWLAGSGYLETPGGGVWIVGGGNGKRMYSRDRGASWKEGARSCTLRTMVSGGGRVVGFCDEGTVIGTPASAGAADPVKWTMQSGNGDGWGRGAYGNGRVVGVWGGATRTPACKVLVDGTDTWKPCGREIAEVVMFADGWFYVTIATVQNDARWSQDGLTWVKRPEPEWRGSGQPAGANGIYVRADTAGLVAARMPQGTCP